MSDPHLPSPDPQPSSDLKGFTRRELIKHGVVWSAAALVAPRLISTANATTAASSVLDSAAVLPPSDKITVKFMLNGRPVEAVTEARVNLLDFLRDQWELTGTKKGCDHGQCGACTVLIDGRRKLSCLSLAASVEGKAVTTIEGLAKGDELHPMQTSFIEHDAFQCGYCTPGQIMSAVGFAHEPWEQSREAIREGMSGNLCRCGAYCGIVAAVEEARASSAPKSL